MTFQLGKNETNTPTPANGKSFLSEVQSTLDELCSRFIDNADDYDSVDEYSYALLSQTWEIVEPALKTSYANGVKRGRSAGTQKGRSFSKRRPS